MSTITLTGKILESLTVFRKHPKTARLTVTRYKLIRLDTLSKYILSESGAPVLRGGVVTDEERKQLFISGKSVLKNIPAGVLK